MRKNKAKRGRPLEGKRDKGEVKNTSGSLPTACRDSGGR